MSDEEEEEQPVVTNISPLRIIITELHEIHLELQRTGFSERNATTIVAYMLSDAMLYRTDTRSGDDDDDDDDDDDNEEPEGDLDERRTG